MKLGISEGLIIDSGELVNFIVEAKYRGYATDGKERVLKDGSKQVSFKRGDFCYFDTYAGHYQFSGRETVRWERKDGQIIWQMNYSGGIEREFWWKKELAKRIYDFLRRALSQVEYEKPFRGPEPTFKDENFKNLLYRARTEGNVSKFDGTESIQERNNKAGYFERLYSLNYNGGLVIPK